MSTKTQPGNYFEDFQLAQEIIHATPRTVTEGDIALYTALFGGRFALNSSAEFARTLGLPQAPIDSLLAFHLVFGKTVPDISLNAVANLGYAGGRFGQPVYPGDTLSTTSKVIGLKQNRDGKTGVVYVRSIGRNQRQEVVLDYMRWVMVRKNNLDAPAPEATLPELPDAVAVDDLVMPYQLSTASYDTALAGSTHAWEDYAVGEQIDHIDGMTIEEAEHMLATRLYQNTARVHFNQHTEQEGRFGRRIIYGGHIISLARSLSFNGLANALSIAAINGGRHTNPTFAGDTVYAWSEIIDTYTIAGRADLGALRVRTVATKNRACNDFPYKDSEGKYDSAVVLDFDYTVLMPRKAAMR
ncbi:MAG: MaoC family dehydratase [Chloroflexaceae bacterium]|nr:MaoC family dehydratase [Chloroflexaceae bacterium]